MVVALFAFAVLLSTISPVFGMILFSFMSMALIFWGLTRKVSAFIAPERMKFAQAMQQSMQHGPISGGLLPLLASFMLMILIVIAAFGGL
ncbi:hypothetical protein [Pseudorhodobacter ferrugineus]|uniref:hypothetical protein n=1 Tax=Pseudorhodobacter ferrugineus TaxID=77008 RepID=UPI0012DE7C0C|nr:hypothetical protein [Pseudorhodobacter ferrugineus]